MDGPTPEEIKELFAFHHGPELTEARQRNASSYDAARTWVDPRGYRLSDRLWQQRQSVRDAIDQRIREGLATGEDALVIAEDLERYLDPRYAPVRDEKGRITEREARAKRGQGVYTREPRDGYGSFPARRLARTEVTRALGSATIASANAHPLSRAVRWLLSNRHVNRDICDAHAEHDEGMGEGIWTADDLPRYPAHPNCICTLSPFVRVPPGELGRHIRDLVAPGTVSPPSEAALAGAAGSAAGTPFPGWRPTMGEEELDAWIAEGAFADRRFALVTGRDAMDQVLAGGAPLADGYLGVGVYLSADLEPRVLGDGVTASVGVLSHKPLRVNGYDDLWKHLEVRGIAQDPDWRTRLREMGYDGILHDATGIFLALDTGQVVVLMSAGDAGTGLPPKFWEVVEQRKRVPDDLQEIIGAPTDILRVAYEIDEKERKPTKAKGHSDTLPFYENLDEHLANWEYYRPVVRNGQQRWEVVRYLTDPGSGKVFPFLTVIGRDQTGSYNVISVHRRDDRWNEAFKRDPQTRKRGER